MNTRARTLSLAFALAAASTPAFQALAQGTHFDPESGYYDSEYRATTPLKPETRHQAEENQWLSAERTLGSASREPIPFPVPSAPGAGRLKPATPRQAAEDRWFDLERESGSESDAPVPFPPPPPATTAIE